MKKKETMKHYFCPFGFWTAEDVLYCMGLIVLAMGAAAGSFALCFPELFHKLLLPCPVHFLTGLYCPGCGGTRALKLLLQGQVINSIIHHPVVLYLAVMGSVFMVTQTVSRFTHGKTRAMRYRNRYLYILIGLYVGNFLWKNIALLVFHVRIIA